MHYTDQNKASAKLFAICYGVQTCACGNQCTYVPYNIKWNVSGCFYFSKTPSSEITLQEILQHEHKYKT